MNATRTSALVLGGSLLLVACGGGSAVIREPFTLEQSGIVIHSLASTDLDATVTLGVTGRESGSMALGDYLTAVTIDTGDGVESFTGSDRIGISPLLQLTATDGSILTLVDPIYAGFDYQTYGVWNSDLGDITTPVGNVGLVTFGTPRTTWDDLNALSEPASFTGEFVGFFTSVSNTVAVAEGNVQLTADFTVAIPEVTFSTSGTLLTFTDVDTVPTPRLNIVSATIPVSELGGTAIYSGSVTTDTAATDPLTGILTGTFYGPAAEETGGLFSLDNDDTGEILEGVFGATQP